MTEWDILSYWLWPSPQSFVQGSHTEATYLARNNKTYGSFSFNQIPGHDGSINTLGSDYFQDMAGYLPGYAPAVAATEVTTYGAGKWVLVNGKMQCVAQAGT